MIIVVTSSLASKGGIDLLRAADQLGEAMRLCLVTDPSTPAYIDQADAVILRIGPLSYGAYKALLPQVHDMSKRRLIEQTLTAFNKCMSYVVLHDVGIAMPRSTIIDHVVDVPFLPGVLKVAVGNQGKGVELLQDAPSFEEILPAFLAQGQCLWQEFIAESKGSDKRVIVYGDTMIASMRRIARDDDFRANLHMSGTAEPYDPTTEEVALAVKAVAALGLPYGGVDIVDSDRGPLVLEVNPSPGFQISAITGVDVAKEIVRYGRGVRHDRYTDD